MSFPIRSIPISALLIACASTARAVPQEQPGAPALRFLTVGSGGVDQRFGTELRRTLDAERAAIDPILAAIAERPLTDGQIRERTGLPDARLQDLLARLGALHLIGRDDAGRWATTVPVITDEQLLRIRRTLLPTAERVADEIRGRLPQLIALYDSVRSPPDPPWERVAHLVIDKFIVDGTFHSAINRIERIRSRQEHYSRDQQVIPAFFVAQGRNYSTFGVNWYAFTEGDAQREVYVLHGSAFRHEIRMNAHRGDSAFSAALFDITLAGGIDALTENDREIFDGLEWIDGGRLLVPVVQAGTLRPLWPALEAIGTSAAAVVFDRHDAIVDAFAGSPYARFLDAPGDYLQACYHTLFAEVLQQLARTGALPEIPQPVPEHFGVYVVMGKLF